MGFSSFQSSKADQSMVVWNIIWTQMIFWLSRHIIPKQLIRRKPKQTLKNMQKLICVSAFGYIHSFLHMPQGGELQLDGGL